MPNFVPISVGGPCVLVALQYIIHVLVGVRSVCASLLDIQINRFSVVARKSWIESAGAGWSSDYPASSEYQTAACRLKEHEHNERHKH